MGGENELKEKNHRITEWLRLEGASGCRLLRQAHLELAAQDCVQMASEYLWGWRWHSLPGQFASTRSPSH